MSAAGTLEIEGPAATCSHCRFTTALTGRFSVEDGLLVWRGGADLQPGRGPDLESCCESDPVVSFDRVEVDGEALTGEQVEALRQSAAQAAGASS
jgi:hypothetical protein